MTTELVKRFTVEIKKDYSLYELFKKGIWYPNIDEYRLFLNKNKKNNMAFARIINKYHLVKRNDNVLETTLSEEISVSEYLKSDSTLVETSYGKIAISNSIDFDYNTCYISNGIYSETLELVHKLSNYGSFIVGVVDNKNSQFYQENREKLSRLEFELRKKKLKIKVFKKEEHRNDVYVLYHRKETL